MPLLAFHTLKPRGASRFPDWLKLKGQMSLIIGRLLIFLYFHISLTKHLDQGSEAPIGIS